MCVDDVGAKPPCAADRPPRKRQIAQLPAGARVEHRALDLVAALGERALDLRDERPEVGVGRAGVHLGDEEDPHGASVCA